MMKARVKPSHSQSIVIAFGGKEMVKGEWRLVSESNKDEAKRHPYLEIQTEEKRPFAVPQSKRLSRADLFRMAKERAVAEGKKPPHKNTSTKRLKEMLGL